MSPATTTTAAFFAAALFPTLAQSLSYTLVKNYSGQDFLSGFTFFDNVTDAGGNLGNLHWVSQSVAQSLKMVQTTSSGSIFLGVDNTTSANGDPNFGRNSLYLTSNEKISIGSLLVLDINHMPYGCSVWPSFFTKGQDNNADWPKGGEIDIIENVNLATANQYALHTDITCTQPSNVTQTGKVKSPNCQAVVTPTDVQNPGGCVVAESQAGSFGQGFQGGVFATQWEKGVGVNIWFFPRASVPSDLSSNQPDPSNWGTPSASYPQSGCDVSAGFADQSIVFDIEICGKFAGSPTVFPTTCGSQFKLCTDVIADPRNYDQAYWDINSLKVFSSSGSSGGNTGGNTTSTGGGNSTNTGGGGGSGNNTAGGGGSNNPGSAMGFRPAFEFIAGLFLLGLLF